MLLDDDKNKRWSNYWEKGHVTSFGKGTPDNYKSGIKDFWCHQFESLDSGSTILDLATGNGAIAMLAVEYSENFSKEFIVLAADAAVISDTVVEDGKALRHYRDKIQFFSSTPCEQLSFKDASVDLMCSQFGIEYSNLTDSIPEASRVLRDGGKFTAIIHHHMSVTLMDTRRDRSIINEALNDLKILDILRQYFIAIGETTDTASIQEARQQPKVITQEKNLFSMVGRLKGMYPENTALKTFLDSVDRFTMDNISKPVTERLIKLENLQENYHAMLERQDDLLNAALSDDAMIELQSLFVRSNFKDNNYGENLDESSQIVGWNVTAQR